MVVRSFPSAWQITLLLLLTVLAPACGSSSSSPDSRGPEARAPDSGRDQLSKDERTAFDRGSNGHLNAQHLLGLADSLFSFDPTIDPKKSAAENAAAIQTQAVSQLGGCGKVTVSGTTVTVDFGPPPGCTLKSGITVSGSISLAVAAASGTATVTAVFTGLVVNGKDLSGRATFATSNATTFTITMSFTSSGTAYNADLTVTGSSGSMTIDGSLSSKSGDLTQALAFNKVVWVLGQCYPSSGSMVIGSGLTAQTITFSSSTPTTGQVQVKILFKTVTAQLPAYGNCPPKSGGG